MVGRSGVDGKKGKVRGQVEGYQYVSEMYYVISSGAAPDNHNLWCHGTQRRQGCRGGFARFRWEEEAVLCLGRSRELLRRMLVVL
jgi:hypothetical protein